MFVTTYLYSTGTIGFPHIPEGTQGRSPENTLA